MLATFVSCGLPKRQLSRGQVEVFDMLPRTAKVNNSQPVR